MNKLTSLWNRAAVFFEDGDLTPVAVVISVAHYGPVLACPECRYVLQFPLSRRTI